MANYILVMDQGTTGSRGVVYDEKGKTVAIDYEEYEQFFFFHLDFYLFLQVSRSRWLFSFLYNLYIDSDIFHSLIDPPLI